MQSTEVWKSIPGYEGFYEVSNLGRVRSLDRMGLQGGHPRAYRGRVLKPGEQRCSGHVSVVLCVDGAQRSFTVHYLVMLAFVGSYPDGMEIRHLNDDPKDNRLENLAYGTRHENMLDRTRNGKHHMANKTHCPHGHEYASWNLDAYTLSLGRRRCKACALARRWGQKRGLPFDPRKADEKYAELISACGV